MPAYMTATATTALSVPGGFVRDSANQLRAMRSWAPCAQHSKDDATPIGRPMGAPWAMASDRNLAERGGFEPPVGTCIPTRGFQPRSFGLSDTSPSATPMLLRAAPTVNALGPPPNR